MWIVSKHPTFPRTPFKDIQGIPVWRRHECRLIVIRMMVNIITGIIVIIRIIVIVVRIAIMAVIVTRIVVIIAITANNSNMNSTSTSGINNNNNRIMGSKTCTCQPQRVLNPQEGLLQPA